MKVRHNERHLRRSFDRKTRRLIESLEDRRVLAAVPFTEMTVIDSPQGRSQQVELFDVDGDSDLDAVALSSEGVNVLFNDGSGSFGDPQPFQDKLAGDARSMVVGDFDGDGDQDVVIGSIAGGVDATASLHTNDGNGNFSLTATLLVGDDDTFIDAITAADVNGDATLDVIAVGRNPSSTIFIIQNAGNDGEGNATFAAPAILTDAFAEPRAVHAADVDGDNDMDILGVSSTGDADTGIHNFFWFANDGAGNFTQNATVIDTLVEPRFMDTSDFDGDGDLDVVMPEQGGNRVVLYENTDAAGTFGAPTVLADDLEGPERTVATDMDNDGDDDVLVSVDSAGSVVWFENTGGNFGAAIVISDSTVQASGAAAGDIDGDTDIDVMSTSQFHATVNRHVNNGDGTFTTTEVTGANSIDPDTALLADLDGDGNLDLLGKGDFEYEIAYYKGDGAGGFGEQVIVSDLTIPPGNQFWWDIDIADIDNDGDLDVITSEPVGNPNREMIWYANDGAGNFGIAGNIGNPGSGITEMVVADMEGDGDNDILALEYFATAVVWYVNDGTGEFARLPVADPTDVQFAELAAGDIDGDGDADVLVGDNGYFARSVIWYEQVKNADETIQFDEIQIIETDLQGVEDVGLADMDGDGDLDAVSGSYFNDQPSTIHWYENTDGKGTFGDTKNVIGEQIFVTELRFVDVDGDGDTDVFGPDIVNGEVEWFDNDANGTVWTEHVVGGPDLSLGAVDFNFQAGPGFIVNLADAGDINGDGKIDFVVSNADEDAYLAYLSGPTNPYDLDQDGDVDGDDVEMLCRDIRDGGNQFDLTGDGVVNTDDMIEMMRGGFNSWVGDSNLDGEFGSGDLVAVFVAGEYEDGIAGNSTYQTGDWNCDGEFDTADLVFVFVEGGFEQGPIAAVAVGAAVLEGQTEANLTEGEKAVDNVEDPNDPHQIDLQFQQVDQVFANNRFVEMMGEENTDEAFIA